MLNFYDTLRMFNRLAMATYEPLLKKIGESIVKSIRSKTASGIDVKGKKFSEYVMPYRKMKVKRGLYPPVNLSLSGQMMGDLTYANKPREVSIGFSTTKSAILASYNQNKNGREFIGISQEIEKEIDTVINNYINQLFKGI